MQVLDAWQHKTFGHLLTWFASGRLLFMVPDSQWEALENTWGILFNFIRHGESGDRLMFPVVGLQTESASSNQDWE
jgi:hypothetical protein